MLRNMYCDGIGQWICLLGEYGGPVRHVGVKMVWGIESLMLDTPGEDD